MDGTMGANGNRVHTLRGSRLRVHSPPVPLWVRVLLLHCPSTSSPLAYQYPIEVNLLRAMDYTRDEVIILIDIN